MYYIAHRLFAAHDRALSARLADTVATRTGESNVFLPFCDTDEENLVADVKGHRLFELDTERLRRLTALVAIVHGPSPDDGVCMEIGFAAALGVPVVLVTTDFQNYSLTPDGPRFTFPDPLLDIVATRIVRVPHTGAATIPAGIVLADTVLADTAGTAPAGRSRFVTFAAINNAQAEAAARTCVETVVQLPVRQHPLTHARIGSSLYVEPSPYGSDCQALREALADRCIDARGPVRFSDADPAAGAREDWRRCSPPGASSST